MLQNAIDDYYLSEQDEATIEDQVRRGGSSAMLGTANSRMAAGHRALPRPHGVRRRLHLLRRAAAAALAA